MNAQDELNDWIIFAQGQDYGAQPLLGIELGCCAAVKPARLPAPEPTGRSVR